MESTSNHTSTGGECACVVADSTAPARRTGWALSREEKMSTNFHGTFCHSRRMARALRLMFRGPVLDNLPRWAWVRSEHEARLCRRYGWKRSY